MRYDVLVIGAGPSGCTAAYEIARRGWRVAVLEQHHEIGHPVNCSGVISFEAFRRYLLPDELIHHTIRSLDFHSPGGLRWRFAAGRIMAYAVDRRGLDRILGRRATQAGADLLLGRRVIGLEREARGITVHTRSGVSDRPVTFEARSVVLATGAGVPLLRQLGWSRFPDRVLGVQTEIPLETTSVEVHLGRKWAPEGFAWIIPLGRDKAKVGLLCRRDGRLHLQRFLERPDVGERLHDEPGPILCSVLPLGFLPRSYAERLLVVGEAAGHIKATTCGGIYYGMLTAEIASQVLDEALKKDQLEADRLDVYEKRWRALLEEEIRMGLKLRRAFRFVSDSILDRLVSLASTDGIAKLIRDKADFDWHRDLIHEVFRHHAIGGILGALATVGGGTLSAVEADRPRFTR